MASLYSRHRNDKGRADPFIDLLFNTLLGFTFLFLVSLLFINPKAKRGSVDMVAEYIITATWPKNLADDIDLWVHAPTGHTASYLQKEAGWLHLDRDDRGELNDTITVDGKEVLYPINQEIITIRYRQAGEYIVNLYYYDKTSSDPVPVEVKVDRVNPTLKTVFAQTFELNAQDQELTALRFSIDREGNVFGINRLPLRLTPYKLDQMPSWVE
ncbi:MAG: hypothetical protein P8Z33_04130 [Gammaproteobacteria bacterium]|jgi:hypothetical protein